jgi:hypothetical protein
MRRTRRIMVGAAALCTASIGLGLGGVAGASVTAPGTPGTPQCFGQTTAFIAQGNFLVPGPGVGNFAKELGATVPEIHEFVASFCTTGVVP